MCQASLDWVTLDDPQKVAHKHQEISRLATTKHDVSELLIHCVRVSVRLSTCICNAMQEVVGAIQIRQGRKPSRAAGMSH